MTDDWWKYIVGFITAMFGAVIKDAVRDGKMSVRMDTAEEKIEALQEIYDSKPCASEILCNERRKECNNLNRREFDTGVARFDKLEKCIREVEQAAQKRHDELMRWIMEISKK
jgi:hypothetical protein